MNLSKVVIAHNWSDVSLNIQTKAVATSLAENVKVVFVSQARISDTPLPTNSNLEVKEWPNKRPDKLKDLWFIYKLLRKEKPEVAIVHFGATNMLLIGAWLARVPHRVAWMHTLSEQYFLDIKSERKAKLSIRIRSFVYGLATKIIVQNEFARQDAISNYKVQPSKLFKIYNGLDDPKRNNENDGSNLSIRYLGRLDYSKGVDMLMDAFVKVAKEFPQAKLEFVGKGRLKEALDKKAIELGLQNQIIFHTPITDYKKIFDFMCAAYCIVVPSRMDNFPTVVLECLATATPVIAAKTGGIPEMIDDDVNGLLFERENVDELEAKLLGLLKDSAKRNSMANAARKKFEEQFIMGKHVEQVMQYLKQP